TFGRYVPPPPLDPFNVSTFERQPHRSRPATAPACRNQAALNTLDLRGTQKDNGTQAGLTCVGVARSAAELAALAAGKATASVSNTVSTKANTTVDPNVATGVIHGK
ncbi:MAG: hypothetical protein ACLQBY_18515, partial [Solirubrobacteraceae bacterium]